MRVLVTGNRGYVGPLVVEALARSDAVRALVGLDVGWFEDAGTFGPLFRDGAMVQRWGDFRDLRAADLAGVDAIVHLAAVSNDPMGRLCETATEEINGAAVAALAREARTAGVGRFVFASSCSLYGGAGDARRRETDPLAPLTAYARGKAAAEAGLARLGDARFTVVALRFATACGWSPRFRSDLALNDFVLSALRTRRVRLRSDGSAWRPLIHVRDMASALAWAALDPGLDGAGWRVFNVGRADMNVRIADLAAQAAAAAGARVEVDPRAGPDRRSYSVDFSRFAAEAPDGLLRHHMAAALDDLVANLSRRAADFAGGAARTVRIDALSARIEAGALRARDLRRRETAAA